MAYIAQTKDKWRVQVEKNGIRKSASFKDKDEAVAWGKALEEKLERKSSIRRVLASMGPPGALLSTYIPSRVLTAYDALPYSINEILEAAIPCDTLVGVYFLIKDDVVIYVGQSIDVLRRISRHRDNDIDFDAYAVVNCRVDQLNDIEGKYIDALLPKYNRHAPRGRSSKRPLSAEIPQLD